MLLNLTVTSLVLSQMSHSPAFAGSSNRYHLDRLRYFRQISPLVFGYRSLLLENSRLRQFTGSVIVARGSNGCNKEDCELSATDGTIRRCEVFDGCGTVAPRYPPSSTVYFIDLDTGDVAEPTDFSVIECAYVGQLLGIIKVGTKTKSFTVTGSCFSESKPGNGAPILLGTSDTVISSGPKLTVDISGTALSKSEAEKGALYFAWAGAFTVDLKLNQANWTENTVTGASNGLITYTQTTFLRVSTTTIEQCAFQHTTGKCILYADAVTGTSGGKGVTTISNSLFWDTKLTNPADGLFVVGETTWTITACYFDDPVTTSEKHKLLSVKTGSAPSITVTDCVISQSYRDFWVVEITDGKTVEASGNTAVNGILVNTFPKFTMNEFMYEEYSEYCLFYTYPPTAPFTPSDTFTPTPYVPTPTSGGGGGGSSGPTASKPITVHIVFAVLTSAGTALVAFGVASLVFLCFRGCCIYDHQNYLKVDI